MNKIKLFVTKHKETILASLGTAAAVAACAVMVVNHSNKDTIRIHRRADLYTNPDPEAGKLKLQFINPDGSTSPVLSYKVPEKAEQE